MKRFLVTIVFITLLTTVMFGHSGRTDSNGGHTNRETGEYHYHNSGKTKKPTPKPAARPETKIYFIQSSLMLLGYNPGPINGVMTTKTENAIKEFQHNNSLLETGKLNKETMDKIKELLSSKTF